MRSEVRPAGEQRDAKTWQDLRRLFIGWSGRPTDPEAAWRQLAADPWYRRELRQLAEQVVRRVGLPGSAAGDVAQDAVLLLARQLRRTPSLNFDPSKPEASFPGWLGRIIENHCREAARLLRQRARREVPLTAEPACDPRRRPDEPRDLAAAIAELADPDRRVLEEAHRGRTLRETADRAGLSYGRTKRAYHRGVRALREQFLDETDSCPE